MLSGGSAPLTRSVGVVIPLVLGVVLSAGIVLDERASARADSESAVRAVVASSVGKVRTEVRNELSAAPAATADRTIPATGLAAAGVSPTAAITASDTGSPTLDDTARPPSIIVPVYRGGAQSASTQQRRAALVGYRVVPLALRSALVELQPASGGLVVLGPNRPVAGLPGLAPKGAVTFAVDMDITGSPGWRVQAWRAAPGTPGVAWLWAAALFLVFVAAAAGIAVVLRRSARVRARLASLERNRALVTGLAPVMQASLDLGEVAPALASHLADGLGLAGLSLSTPGERGDKQVFAWGRPPDPSVRAGSAASRTVEAGQTLALPLSRAGRTLGLLRVLAGARLAADELETLRTAAELLGATLANAEAFARQHELVERMRSVDELKTVFLATASHELRTPVTAIVGFSTLLLDRWADTPPAQQRMLIERVQANGQRLNTLIEQLLDFSRLERGLPHSASELFDLGEVVGRILADQPELAAGHELRTVLADDVPVRGSVAAVERIVSNLVGNAAKYSPAGTTITVTVRGDSERVALVVDDEGPGVPVEDRDRVFSRFYRGSGAEVVRTRGAGIGLAIVAEYAASMAGAVTVTSAPGGGARFTASFPAARAAYAHSSSGGDADAASA